MTENVPEKRHTIYKETQKNHKETQNKMQNKNHNTILFLYLLLAVWALSLAPMQEGPSRGPSLSILFHLRVF